MSGITGLTGTRSFRNRYGSRGGRVGGRLGSRVVGRSARNINRSPSGQSGGNTSASNFQAKQEGALAGAEDIAKRQSAMGAKMEATAGRIGDRDVAAGEAASDVAASYDSAIGQQQRNLQRYGVDPTSGRFSHSQRVMANARAAAMAGARTRARRTADREAMLAYGQTIGGLGQATGTQFGLFEGYGDLAYDRAAMLNQQAPQRASFSFGGGGGSRRITRGGFQSHNLLRKGLTDQERARNRARLEKGPTYISPIRGTISSGGN